MHSAQATPDSREQADQLVNGRFSIRLLLLVTLAIGCWLALLQMTPHIAILSSGVIGVLLSTWFWLRVRRTSDSRLIKRLIGLVVVLAWAYLYVVSIGPAKKIVREHYGRNDMIAIYAPVGWLHANTPLRGPLMRYAELWGEPVEAVSSDSS
jgi:hypothetical protein